MFGSDVMLLVGCVPAKIGLLVCAFSHCRGAQRQVKNNHAMDETGSELRGWTRRNFLKATGVMDARCFPLAGIRRRSLMD